jgi:hypothetical protein
LIATSPDSQSGRYTDLLKAQIAVNDSPGIILDDDYAPVEKMVSAMLSAHPIKL